MKEEVGRRLEARYLKGVGIVTAADTNGVDIEERDLILRA
jgi:hypothetical protein